MENLENIAIANPFTQDNETWAVCYLRDNGDEKNVFKLDNKRFTIIRFGKIRSFEIQEIKNIYKTSKRLLLPLILGGILSPLAIIAIYENLFSPFLLLTTFFSGIFLLYLGWAGTYAIVLNLQDGIEEFIFLQSIPMQVSKFIDFFNMFLLKNSDSGNIQFYHVFHPVNGVEEYDFNKERLEGYVLFTQKEFEAYKLKSNSDYKVIKIDPLKLESPVTLKTFPDGRPFFTIKLINPESIIK